MSPPCALGSVKGNIGHANCAAGITGFIKTVLCLHHKTLVPTCHYEKLNEKINFQGTRFHVNEKTTKWMVDGGGGGGGESKGPTTRVAGVSSFGVGGTNAHVILQEAPPNHPTAAAASTGMKSEQKKENSSEIFLLSAKTKKSLKRSMRNLLQRMEQDNNQEEENRKKEKETEAASTKTSLLSLADVAFTLSTGREHMSYRTTVVSESKNELKKLLKEMLSDRSFLKNIPKTPTRGSPVGGDVVFVFPGQGSQYLGMSKNFHATNPTFRSHLEYCASLINEIMKRRNIHLDGGVTNILAVLFGEDKETFARPTVVQPCIFMVEYSMAMTLIENGIVPMAMGGAFVLSSSSFFLSFFLSNSLFLLFLSSSLQVTRLENTSPQQLLACSLSVMHWSSLFFVV
jgi:acyl transferase domain-containing protein